MDRTQVISTYKGPLQERSLDIGRALKSVNLIQSSVDCRANVEPGADAGGGGAPGASPPPLKLEKI